MPSAAFSPAMVVSWSLQRRSELAAPGGGLPKDARKTTSPRPRIMTLEVDFYGFLTFFIFYYMNMKHLLQVHTSIAPRKL